MLKLFSVLMIWVGVSSGVNSRVVRVWVGCMWVFVGVELLVLLVDVNLS